MSTQDIRWKQRFNSYVKALDGLSVNIELCKKSEERLEHDPLERDSFNLDRSGLIQTFEYIYELSWNTMKDYLEYQGFSDLIGAKDTFRMAFKQDLIANGEVWMAMIESRNKTSHGYEENIATEIYEKIINDYYPAFMEMKKTFEEK